MVDQPDRPRGIVLFGPGAGGDPRRYSTLIDAFTAAGLLVLAPAGERFDPQTVTTEQLQGRVDALRSALADHPERDLPVTAVGHSVGGWAALCLAGAQPWGRDGRLIPVTAEPRVTRVVLLAPTVGWFRAPGALSGVTCPVVVHVGDRDVVTPAASAEILRAASGPVSITVHDNVGHFDVMTDLPPTVPPTPGLDRAAFLTGLAAAVLADLV